MSPKKITVVDASGGESQEVLSNEEGYNNLVDEYSVASLTDNNGAKIRDFGSLVDGGNYTLGPPKEQQEHIFSHGLPEMGPLSQTTKFTSNPSIPAEDQHAAACLQISTFVALSDLEELPCPKTNIWNQVLSETGALAGFSGEADVNNHVRKVIDDILEALHLRGKVEIRAEVEVMRNRPDFMLILVNGHPIGTIEGKQPGKNAMEHPNILGEVYDQLLHLRSIFRVNTPFAILTCYNQWRICWLNDQDSQKCAGMDRVPEPVPFVTPVKRKQILVNALQDMQKEEKKDSPTLPPTPSRMIRTKYLQKVDVASVHEESELGCDDEARIFWGTDVLEWNDRKLPMLLVSLIKKMMLAQQMDRPPVLRLANERSSIWRKTPLQSSLNFHLCISHAVKNFFLWEDLGHGADGRAFLVSGGTKGAVGVLKFFFTDAKVKAQHEQKMWKQVYGHLPPVEKSVRIVTVMGQTALLMPFFQCPERTQSSVNAVEKTLREDFMKRKYRHWDVAWRNVGVYSDDGGQTKAVVFDMQTVRLVGEDYQDETWVKTAVKSLAQKLNH